MKCISVNYNHCPDFFEGVEAYMERKAKSLGIPLKDLSNRDALRMLGQDLKNAKY